MVGISMNRSAVEVSQQEDKEKECEKAEEGILGMAPGILASAPPPRTTRKATPRGERNKKKKARKIDPQGSHV